MMTQLQKDDLKKVEAELKRTTKYIARSVRALNKNTKKMKRLQRKREMILTPMLPGIFD